MSFGMSNVLNVHAAAHHQRAAVAAGEMPISGAAEHAQCAGRMAANAQRIICCTPRAASGVVSCLKSVAPPAKALLTTDPDLAIIPANVVIDSVEFYGVDGFSTKDEFSIGLGQLNHGIAYPLIEEATDDIANDKSGGCRQFHSMRIDGRSEQRAVLFPSNVNVAFKEAPIAGHLVVDIRYHAVRERCYASPSAAAQGRPTRG
jgi:hypothetical protein